MPYHIKKIMLHLKNYLPAVIMALFILGCTKDEDLTGFQAEIDARLQVYFDSFQEEAAARGVVIDYNVLRINGQISDLEGNISGQCQSNSIEPNLVIVDPAFWARSNELEREFLIFHELGHCGLDRNHLDATLPDGTCSSMMHSGTSGCRNNYNQATRTYYLDELFYGQ